MKKVSGLFIGAICVFIFAGCGNTGNINDVKDEPVTVSESKLENSKEATATIQNIVVEDSKKTESEQTEDITDDDVAIASSVLPEEVEYNLMDGQVSKEDFRVIINGIGVEMGIDINTLISSLGDPDVYSSARSCIDDGEEKQYVYGGYTIYTYPNKTEDIIYLIEFSEEAYTDANIGIGSTKSDVEKVYGKETDVMGDYVLYNCGELSCISFQFVDNIVTYLDMYYKE